MRVWGKRARTFCGVTVAGPPKLSIGRASPLTSLDQLQVSGVTSEGKNAEALAHTLIRRASVPNPFGCDKAKTDLPMVKNGKRSLDS